MAKSKIEKRRLGRRDWIDAAIERLIKSGVDAVRVEPLADSLNVSRGSFYWHFKSRRELLEAVLETWREDQTNRIVERIRQDANLEPVQRLVRLRMLPPRTRTSAEAAAFELAIRAWALRDKAVRKVVDQVDAKRVDFSDSLLADAKMPAKEARYWALIGYAYTLGESLLRASMTDDEILECRSRMLSTQTQHLGERDKVLREARQQLLRAGPAKDRKG